MVTNVGGGQWEERLACLVGRNGGDASRAETRLDGLCFAPLVSRSAIRAAGTAVCAFPDVAGVCRVGTVRAGLDCISVLFGMAVIAVGAGRAALLMHSFSSGSLAVRRGLPTRGLVLSVSRLLLSQSWWGAAAGPGAGRRGVGRIGLLASGGTSVGGNIIAGHPEPDFVAAAGAAGSNSVSATVCTALAVGFEATLVLQGGAVLAQLQAGHG